LLSQKTERQQKWALDSIALQDTFTDFVLSRQAILCSPATVKWYSWTLGKFHDFLQSQGLGSPAEVTSRHIRQYLAQLAAQDLKDTYIHSHARAIRTYMRFLHREGYHPSLIAFDLPAIAQRKLASLSSEQVKQVIGACSEARDLALILLMIDTGIRRAELIALNWGDVDIDTGLVRIAKGKGGKSRSIVIGVNTRRALLKYRREVGHEASSPLFQTRRQTRFAANGLRSAILRIARISGVPISPHMLRRTFATLSLKNKMNVLHLQGLMGHSSLQMTERYIQLLEADLIEAHREHGPIDNL
jgi:integrase/recombinase XerD